MPDASRPTVNYFCLGALFVFVGSVLLCTLGFTVVLPFEVMRSWPQVFCTVLNSSYDVDVCSCDEQVSVFDTCISEYPCLKIYVSYVVKASNTSSPPHPPSVYQNSSSSPMSDDHHHQDRPRRHRRSADASLEAPVVDYSVTSTANASDVRPSRQLAKVDDAEMLSSSNISQDGHYIAIPVSTDSPAATQDSDGHPAGIEYQASLEKVTGNGSEAMTSYRIARDTREAVTDYDLRDWTPTTTSDMGVNRSYVAKLYRSWDDSFLPECSLTECDDNTWNVKQARLFQSKWGQVGQTFSCFYNPERQDVVILERTTPFAAVNAVVWPCLLLLAGVSLWIGLCLGCWSFGDDASYKEEYAGVASLRLQ